VADTLTTKGLTILDPNLAYDVNKFNANFNLINTLLGTIICTSTTRPSSLLWDGMTLWETDTRRFVVRVAAAWVAVPQLVTVANAAARTAITTPYDGQMIYRQDRDWWETYDGAAWRVQGVAVCTSTTDRGTNITSPYSGQLAMTTDTDTLWQYDGVTAAWLQVGGVRAPRGLLAAPVQGTANVNFTTTATLVDSITWDHVQGRYEEFRFSSRFSLNTNGVALMQFRGVAGAGPVNNTHTVLYEAIPTGSGSNNNMTIMKVLPSSFRSLPSAQYTIGVFATAAAGATTGVCNGVAGNIERDFVGYDVGAP
jgi:hypothetical protein